MSRLHNDELSRLLTRGDRKVQGSGYALHLIYRCTQGRSVFSRSMLHSSSSAYLSSSGGGMQLIRRSIQGISYVWTSLLGSRSRGSSNGPIGGNYRMACSTPNRPKMKLIELRVGATQFIEAAGNGAHCLPLPPPSLFMNLSTTFAWTQGVLESASPMRSGTAKRARFTKAKASAPSLARSS